MTRQAHRLEQILEELSDKGAISVGAISGRLRVSPATIRRDLELLEQQRLLSRTHGGAVAHGVLYELPLRYRGGQRREEKRCIAEIAAKRVVEGSVIGFTGGTTTTEVAKTIVDRRRLTVVTNALNIAAELVVRPNIKLVVTGGVARGESYELSGPLAENTLSQLHLDVVFVGVDGLSAEVGLTTHHEVEGQTNRLLIGRSGKVIVVADSSKIGKITFAQICAIDDVDELITDSGAAPLQLQAFRDAGLQVTCAQL